MEKGSNPSEIVEAEKIPWHWIIPLCVVWPIIGIILTPFVRSPYIVPFGPLVGSSAMSPAPFVIIFLLFLLAQAIPTLSKMLGLDQKKLTYLYIAIVTVSLYSANMSQGIIFQLYHTNRISNPVFSTKYIPWFFMPPKEVLAGSLLPGKPIPWDAYVPSIVTFSSLAITMSLLGLAFASILRRQWIDVEMLPFPYATAATTLISTAAGRPEGERLRLSKKTLLSIAALIGFLVYVYGPLRVIWPWFPDLYGWETDPTVVRFFPASYNVRTKWPDVGKAIVGITYMNVNPFWAAIAFLAPLTSLFSAWVAYVVFFIVLPQILYQFGYYTGMENVSGSTRWTRIMQQDPLKLQAFTYMGMIPAIAVFWIALNWKYLAATLRQAFGRVTEKGKEEALTYRNLYLMLLLLTILAAVQFAIYGIEALPILVLLAFVFVQVIAAGRCHGLMGYIYIGNNDDAVGWMKAVWPTITDATMTPSYVQATWLGNRVFGTDSHFAFTMPFIFTIENYRIASSAGISSKAVFKIILAATIIGPLIALPTQVWVYYTFGSSVITRFASPGWDGITGVTRPTFYNPRPATEPWWPHALAGFAFTGVLAVLHARFLWFPLEPVGMLVGLMGFNSADYGLWFQLLLAWIAKTLVLKIGGSKAYENYGVPIATGYIIGSSLVFVVQAICAAFRYFVPA